ncbi:hypothetical protein CLOP_g226 [Closterium sp. NIES-67]|nr:hypothetical protein CLOP_g226 [Closterium sp. NIES-67]
MERGVFIARYSPHWLPDILLLPGPPLEGRFNCRFKLSPGERLVHWTLVVEGSPGRLPDLCMQGNGLLPL